MRRRVGPTGLLLLIGGLVRGSAALAAAAPPDVPIDDDYLRGYIVSFLEQSMHLRPDRVQVAVSHGVVTLTGDVTTPEEIDHIVQAIVSFPGVETVDNRLSVEEPPGGRRFKSWTQWPRPPPGRTTVRFPS